LASILYRLLAHAASNPPRDLAHAVPPCDEAEGEMSDDNQVVEWGAALDEKDDEIGQLRAEFDQLWQTLRGRDAEIERLRARNAQLLAALKTFVAYEGASRMHLPWAKARALIAEAEGWK
jgi:hypothetical protein